MNLIRNKERNSSGLPAGRETVMEDVGGGGGEGGGDGYNWEAAAEQGRDAAA